MFCEHNNSIWKHKSFEINISFAKTVISFQGPSGLCRGDKLWSLLPGASLFDTTIWTGVDDKTVVTPWSAELDGTVALPVDVDTLLTVFKIFSAQLSTAAEGRLGTDRTSVDEADDKQELVVPQASNEFDVTWIWWLDAALFPTMFCDSWPSCWKRAIEEPDNWAAEGLCRRRFTSSSGRPCFFVMWILILPFCVVR